MNSRLFAASHTHDANHRALDGLSLIASDLPCALGPFLSAYLLVNCHWDPGAIGLALAVNTWSSTSAQLLMGTVVDRLPHQHWAIIGACSIVGLGIVALLATTNFWLILAAMAFIGVGWSMYQPGLTAVSLQIAGLPNLSGRLGRNQAINHTGNVLSLLVGGIVAQGWGIVHLFYLLIAQAALSVAMAMGIRSPRAQETTSISAHPSASEKGSDPVKLPQGESEKGVALSWRHPVVPVTIAFFVLQIASAALLPLLTQQVTVLNEGHMTSLYTSGFIVAAQLAMIPSALITAKLVKSMGRKPLFLGVFLLVALRGLLYTWSHDPIYLVMVQLLDGIAGGIMGVLFGLLSSDLAEGNPRRLGFMQGIILSGGGAGGGISQFLSGMLAQTYSYNMAFMALSAIALVGACLVLRFVPETYPQAARPRLLTQRLRFQRA